ncbi:MAG: hypothetical protein ACR2PT_00755 [Endozoicomonas sp.]
MSILLSNNLPIKRLKPCLYFLLFLSVLVAYSSQATPPCDQLDSPRLQEQCNRFLHDTDSSGSSLENHYFSKAKALYNSTDLMEGLKTADDSGVIWVLGQDILVHSNRELGISKPIALLGDPDNPPRLEFSFSAGGNRPRRDEQAVSVTSGASRFFAWGISWIAASVGLSTIINVTGYRGEIGITHCTFRSTAPEALSTFVDIAALSQEAKATLASNQCYTDQVRYHCFLIFADAHSHPTVSIFNNQWLSSSNDTYPEKDSGVVFLANVKHGKIIGNRQVSTNSRANIKVTFVRLIEGIPAINITIQNNTAHSDSASGVRQIELINAIGTSGNAIDCIMLTGSCNISDNHGYFICKQGNLDEFPELDISIQEGDQPGSIPSPSPVTTQVLRILHGRVSSLQHSHQKVPFCLPSVICPTASSGVTDSLSDTDTSIPDLATLTIAMITTASDSPVPSPTSPPEVPNADESDWLSPGSKVALMIAGCVFPAIVWSLWPFWTSYIWNHYLQTAH